MAYDYSVGDEFEGGPIELNRWLSPVWAIGGRVEFDGNKATIVYLPPSALPPETPVEEYFESFTKQLEPEVKEQLDKILEAENSTVEDEPVVEAPVEEELSVAEDLAPIEEAVKEPAPKYRGRPKKTVDPVDKVNPDE